MTKVHGLDFRTSSWDDVFIALVNAGIYPHIVNRILIYGFSRTGKTTLAKKLCGGEEITFHPAMPLDDLIGGMSPNPDPNGPPFIWCDGPATRAMRNGTTLVVNEFNDVPPECKTMLYALGDKPAGITLPTGERIDAKPGYGIVATMNPPPSVLVEPLYERFDIVLQANELSKGTVEALGPYAEQAKRVVGRGNQYTWTRPMSVGLLLAANTLRQAGVTGENLATALGLIGDELTDFLAVVAE